MEGINEEASRNTLIEHLGVNETATVTLFVQATGDHSNENKISKNRLRILTIVSNYQRAEEEGRYSVVALNSTSIMV